MQSPSFGEFGQEEFEIASYPTKERKTRNNNVDL